MNKKIVFEKIEDVLRIANRSLAVHEFQHIDMIDLESHQIVDGREYVGCSESTLGRQLRLMRELGRVTSKIRNSKAFKEYSLAIRKPVQQELALEMR